MVGFDFHIEGVYNDGNFSERLHLLLSDFLEGREDAGEILEYSHTLTEEDANGCIAHIQLSYNGECGVTEANENLVRDFCYALLNEDATESLMMVSSYGILGFSSGGNAVGALWNLIAVQAMLRNGSALFDVMMQRKYKPSPDKDAAWIHVVRMVANTALSHCFGLDASLNKGENAQKLFDRIGELSADKVRTAEDTLTYLRNLTLTKCQTASEETRLSEARKAYDAFHDISTKVCQRVEDFKGSVLPKSSQRELLAQLFELQLCVCRLFSSTEALMDLYASWFVQQAATAACNFIDAGVVGVQAMATLNAAGTFKEAAVTIMRNVPKEGLVTQAGRWAGLVTSEMPLKLAKQQAVVATTSATILRGVGFANAGFAAYSLGKGAFQSYQAVQSFKKKKACENLSIHSLNTAFLIMQCRISMVWLNVIDGKVRFVGEAKSEFERYVRASYPGPPDATQLTPESMMDELRNRAMWLKKYGAQIRLKHRSVLASGD